MNTETVSALLCRALGLGLLIFGLSLLLPALIYGPRPGWTSYAPLRGEQEQTFFWTTLRLALRWNLPSIVQAVAGLILLAGSRPLGRLLARGLLDRVP